MSDKNHIEEESKSFEDFGLKAPLLQAIVQLGFRKPSEVQELSIPILLEGNDLIAQAQTGTGKTAAFAIPILNNLTFSGGVEALIITPTRELAVQISSEMYKLGRFLRAKVVCFYGGQSISIQMKLMHANSPQIIVATPGRLLDHLSNGRIKDFNPRMIVLDESDEMLDMGFIDDVEAIFRFLPSHKQTMLFSATMPLAIKRLAEKILDKPRYVKIDTSNVINTDIEQKYYVVNENDRDESIIRLLDALSPSKCIIFVRTKREADLLHSFLIERGYSPFVLHGDISQPERMRAIRSFKEEREEEKISILVATDVASRGLDVLDVSHVFNYHLPMTSEAYVHRIGRTGRAGKKGMSITLVTPLEYRSLRNIKNQVKADIELFELEEEVFSEEKFIEEILSTPKHHKARDILKVLKTKAHQEVQKDSKSTQGSEEEAIIGLEGGGGSSTNEQKTREKTKKSEKDEEQTDELILSLLSAVLNSTYDKRGEVLDKKVVKRFKDNFEGNVNTNDGRSNDRRSGRSDGRGGYGRSDGRSGGYKSEGGSRVRSNDKRSNDGRGGYARGTQSRNNGSNSEGAQPRGTKKW